MKKSRKPENDNGGIIYTPYITRNGKKIYRRNGGMFRFPGTRKKA